MIPLVLFLAVMYVLINLVGVSMLDTDTHLGGVLSHPSRRRFPALRSDRMNEPTADLGADAGADTDDQTMRHTGGDRP